jgi:Tetratricopeptide repeat
VQQNAITTVFGNGKADRVRLWLRREPRAAAWIAHIAEIFQLTIAGLRSFCARSAATGEAGAKGKPMRKRPVNLAALLGREKVRASHNTHILVLFAVSVLNFFLMSEPNRLEMLKQFLEQNPNDAFARYGLAMEYSKAGDTQTALQEFARLLELHPDYTGGYFMAAQTLAKIEKNDEAKAMLQKGIAAAQRTGNKHALSEMSAMLDELS